MSHALTNTLAVSLFRDAEEAIKAGFVYREPEHTPLKITDTVVIEKGTVNGNPTVDLVLVDESGKKYVTTLTGNLLRTIPI